MRHERYLKFILTVIALELLWIGAREAAPRVSAQTPAAPVRVIITGADVAGLPDNLLPVRVVGAARVEGAVTATLRTGTTVKVEADPPLAVQQVPYTPAPRPGE